MGEGGDELVELFAGDTGAVPRCCPHSKPHVPGCEELPTLHGMGSSAEAQTTCLVWQLGSCEFRVLLLLLAPSEGRRGTALGLVAMVRDSRGRSWVAPGEEDTACSEVWRTERDSPALMTAGSTPTAVEATATPSLLNYLEL